MTASATPALLLQLLATTRWRLWLRHVMARLTTASYLSAGCAAALAITHIWVMPVSGLVWSVAVAIPLLFALYQTLVHQRPTIADAAVQADAWFATQELFSSALYVFQGQGGAANPQVASQLVEVADSTAAGLASGKARQIRIGGDPRLLLAALCMACSALLVLSVSTAQRGATLAAGVALQVAGADSTSWLAQAATDVQRAQDNTQVRSAGANTEQPPTAFAQRRVAAGEDASLSSSPNSESDESSEALSSSATLDSADLAGVQDTAAVPTATADEVADRASVQSASLGGGNRAATSSASSKHALTKSPASATQATPNLSLRRRVDIDQQAGSLQLTAQSGGQTTGQPGAAGEPSNKVVSEERLSIVAAPAQARLLINRAELANQLAGPAVGTLATRYQESRQP